MENKDRQFSNILKRVLQILSLIFSFGILVFAYLKYKGENLKVNVQTTSLQSLTPKTTIDDLIGKYYYRDTLINNLWSIELSFINTGTGTIIGKGPKKDLINNDLKFQFQNSRQIVKIENIRTDFYSDMDILDSSKVSLKFNQWRETEELKIRFYIASSQRDIPPKIEKISRDIIDGDIYIQEFDSSGMKGKKIGLNYLPSNLALLGKVLGIIFTILLAILIIISYSNFTVNTVKFFFWKRKYYHLYLHFIENKKSDNSKYFSKFTNIEKIINDPTSISVPSSVWVDSKIPKPSYFFKAKNLIDYITYSLIFFVVIFTQFSIILGLIVF